MSNSDEIPAASQNTLALRVANTPTARRWFEQNRSYFPPTLTRRLSDGGLAFVFRFPLDRTPEPFGIEGVEIATDDGCGTVLRNDPPAEWPRWLDAERGLRVFASGARDATADGGRSVRQWLRWVAKMVARRDLDRSYAGAVLTAACVAGGMFRHEAGNLVVEEFNLARGARR